VSTDAFLSPLWYRVAALKPSLKRQVRIRRHRYRGQVWYVVQDPASGRFHRFSPATCQLLGLMDGRRTMDEVWAEAAEQLGEAAPTQDETVRLLSQLHASDLLDCDVTPDFAELFERHSRQSSAQSTGRWRNPLAIRIPLWDPDRFLERTWPLLRPLTGIFGGLVYLLVVVLGGLSAAAHWQELTADVSDRLLAAHNLVLLWLCFPVVKLLHELGHAYATKAGGGEVHDIGVLFLVFTPIPYVDATAATGFRSSWRRTLVGAAGMLTELFIASLAMLFWAAAEPGLARAIAFDVMFIAGVSTVVFNGNPLLRFDGYYILSDLIEIPNLAQRGMQYWRSLIESRLFRIKPLDPPVLSPGERAWFLVYTPAAFVYRIFVLIAIVTYVASVWFFIGVLLAIWGAVAMVVMPLLRAAGYVLSLPRQGRARQRALTVTFASLALIMLFVGVVPMPQRLITEGVVWLPEEAYVRAGTDGFVQKLLVPVGSLVGPGAALVESADPAIETRLKIASARIDEFEARLQAQMFRDRVRTELARAELAREQATVARESERVQALITRSAAAGKFEPEESANLAGRFFHQGETIGYVTPSEGSRIVRIVVPQDDVDLVRSRLAGVDVRLATRMSEVFHARLVREVPAARDYFPSPALSSAGGGALVADPSDPMGAKSLASTFQFDVELPEAARTASYGARAYVRLVLQPEQLVFQWGRRIRQLFLARFDA